MQRIFGDFSFFLPNVSLAPSNPLHTLRSRYSMVPIFVSSCSQLTSKIFTVHYLREKKYFANALTLHRSTQEASICTIGDVRTCVERPGVASEKSRKTATSFTPSRHIYLPFCSAYACIRPTCTAPTHTKDDSSCSFRPRPRTSQGKKKQQL
jgi:hypothetical protein